MDLLEKILLVVFAVVSVILVLCVLVQDDGQNGMGGLLGGRGTAAFGSHSASVLTKATVVLVVLFFALSVGIARLHRVSAQPTAEELSGTANTEKTVDETSTEASENTQQNETTSPSERKDW